MNKTTLLISGLFFFIFASFVFAAGKVTPLKWDKPVDMEDFMEVCPPEELTEGEFKKPTVTNIKGKFAIMRSGKEEFYDSRHEQLKIPSIELKDGDLIKTYDGSTIINFSDGSSFTLYNRTSLIYNETEVITKIKLLVGKLRILLPSNLLKKLKTKVGAKLETRMRASAACIRGTDFIMEQAEDMSISKYYLHEGSLDIVNLRGETMQLNSGDIATIDGDGKMILEKMEQGQWEQLIGEIGPVETSGQIDQSGAKKQETLKWFGLIAVLLCAAVAGVFIYRKFLKIKN